MSLQDVQSKLIVDSPNDMGKQSRISPEQCSRSLRLSRGQRRKLFLLLLVGWTIVGLGLSGVTFGLLRKSAQKSLSRELGLKCNSRAQVLVAEWTDNLNAAGVFTGLIKTFPNISEAEFIKFASETSFTRPDIARIVWLERLTPDRRADYENRQGSKIFQINHNLTLTPRALDYEYAPITRVTGEGLAVLNGDPMSVPTLRVAIEAARDSGEVVLSCVDTFSGVAKVACYYPVYIAGFEPANKTVEERRQSCRGYVGAVTWVNSVHHAALSGFDGDSVDVAAWDVTESGKPTSERVCPQLDGFMYGNPSVGQGDYTVPFRVGGRNLELRCKDPGNKGLAESQSAIAWTAMILAVVLLSAVILLLTVKRMQAVEKEVEVVSALNEELEEAKTAAQAADRAKGSFIATMSHEIRTPLSGVIGMTNLLMETSLDAYQADLCRTAQASGNALVAIVNDVLDFSKIEAGHMEIESLEFDVRAELDTALGLFAERARQRNLELLAFVHEAVPEKLVGDPGRLLQIVNNLVSNAMKFTKSGSVYICVTLADPSGLSNNDPDKAKEAFAHGAAPPVDWAPLNFSTPHKDGPYLSMLAEHKCTEAAVERFLLEGRAALQACRERGTVRLLVSVEDTGIGIPPSVQPRLFRPFLQADSSTSRQYGGTGIGLSITGRLVALMGGRMRVNSTPDLGSIFQFDLKLSLPPQQAEAASSAEQKPGALPCLKGCRVAVIGPNAVRRAVICDCLKRLGLLPHSLRCSQAMEAIERAAQAGSPYRLVICHMEPSVWECVEAFARTMTKEKPMLGEATSLIVAPVTPYEDEALLRLGFSSVLAPPVRRAAVAAAVAAACKLDVARTVSSESDRGPWLQGKTVLVVDDALINRKVVSRLLERHGCTTVAVPSGQEALPFFQASSAQGNHPWIDLVFMDVQMPEMDGYETVRRLRQLEAESCSRAHPGQAPKTLPGAWWQPPPTGEADQALCRDVRVVQSDDIGRNCLHRCRVPIVALTADVVLGTREKCVEAGMDDYASKPVNQNRLQNVLEKYLNLRDPLRGMRRGP